MNVRKPMAAFATYVFVGLAYPTYAADESLADPKALQILRQMSDYLGSLQQFTFRVEATLDTMMRSGEKLEMGDNVDVAILRPNRFRVSRSGDLGQQEFYFDGKTLTLYEKTVNYYARLTASAPQDIDVALDFARSEVGVIAPASDLFYQNAYAGLVEDVESGRYVGSSTVGGSEVHHLAFRGSEVDWQIWIETGDKPLPRKYVITSKWITGAPQFAALFTDWNTSAQLEDTSFDFSPPPGAEQIQFIPLRADVQLTPEGGTR